MKIPEPNPSDERSHLPKDHLPKDGAFQAKRLVDSAQIIDIRHHQPHYSRLRPEALELERKHFSYSVKRLRDSALNGFPSELRERFWDFAKSIYGHALANAIDASYEALDSGTRNPLDIYVQMQVGVLDRNKLFLSIDDNGLGIPYPVLEKLFEGADAVSRRGNSKGLFLGGEGHGLLLMSQHVERLGGDLIIETVSSKNCAWRLMMLHETKSSSFQRHLMQLDPLETKRSHTGVRIEAIIPINRLNLSEGQTA